MKCPGPTCPGCDATSCYADGGEVDGADDQAMLDHCAMECMKAIESGDKSTFRDSLHVLISDILNRMQETTE